MEFRAGQVTLDIFDPSSRASRSRRTRRHGASRPGRGAARAELEANGVEFDGRDRRTRACVGWRSSMILTETRSCSTGGTMSDVLRAPSREPVTGRSRCRRRRTSIGASRTWPGSTRGVDGERRCEMRRRPRSLDVEVAGVAYVGEAGIDDRARARRDSVRAARRTITRCWDRSSAGGEVRGPQRRDVEARAAGSRAAWSRGREAALRPGGERRRGRFALLAAAGRGRAGEPFRRDRGVRFCHAGALAAT